MGFQIEILSVSSSTTPTAKGSYTTYEVAFKKDGKIDGKKIMSFSPYKDVVKAVAAAKAGDVFNVESAKNEKGYWDWTSLTSGQSDQPQSTGTTSTASSAARTSPKSTYETPEERAARQVMIVRQSSLSNAISLLKTDKKQPELLEVLATADQMVAWVLQTQTQAAAGASDTDIESDLPF